MHALRRWLFEHWLLGALAILGGLWLLTALAYVSGLVGFTVVERHGRERVAIDFMRRHERPYVGLTEGVGLELDAGGTSLRGTIVRLEPSASVLAFVCGRNVPEGELGIVTHRQGDWFFRAPSDESSHGEAVSLGPEARASLLTLAYDRGTGERVVVEPDTPVAAQHALLAARGLAVSDATRLDVKSLADLSEVSVLREGCVIFNGAFAALAALWLALGGLVLLLGWIVDRRRGRRAR